ncbi:hypothetical protein EBZ80_19080, partial [bacterium]|nr:hypothetical protein [bacterium]
MTSTANVALTTTVGANTTTAIYGQFTLSSKKSACVFLANYTHDNVAPTVTYVSSSPGSSGDTIYTLTLYSNNTCTTVFGSATGVAANTNMAITGQVTANATTSIYGKATDLAGNTSSSCGYVTTYTHPSAAAPTIASVTLYTLPLLSFPATIDPSSTTYLLNFKVSTSVPVNVTGSPTLAFTIGGSSRTATYASGSGSSNLIFTYSPSASSDSGALVSGTSLTLGAATIRSSSGNVAMTNLNYTQFTPGLTFVGQVALPTVVTGAPYANALCADS